MAETKPEEPKLDWKRQRMQALISLNEAFAMDRQDCSQKIYSMVTFARQQYRQLRRGKSFVECRRARDQFIFICKRSYGYYLALRNDLEPDDVLTARWAECKLGDISRYRAEALDPFSKSAPRKDAQLKGTWVCAKPMARAMSHYQVAARAGEAMGYRQLGYCYLYQGELLRALVYVIKAHGLGNATSKRMFFTISHELLQAGCPGIVYRLLYPLVGKRLSFAETDEPENSVFYTFFLVFILTQTFPGQAKHFDDTLRSEMGDITDVHVPPGDELLLEHAEKLNEFTAYHSLTFKLAPP